MSLRLKLDRILIVVVILIGHVNKHKWKKIEGQREERARGEKGRQGQKKYRE